MIQKSEAETKQTKEARDFRIVQYFTGSHMKMERLTPNKAVHRYSQLSSSLLPAESNNLRANKQEPSLLSMSIHQRNVLKYNKNVVI